ncbi:MAG: hypothetical protein JOZ49_03210 [Mycolicibacterium sp.]|nr:hypothetical protein [Mycolicibacterium sp.]
MDEPVEIVDNFPNSRVATIVGMDGNVPQVPIPVEFRPSTVLFDVREHDEFQRGSGAGRRVATDDGRLCAA